MYFASDEEREIVCYFLLFHEIREVPKQKEKPVVDRRVIGHVLQSESENLIRVKSLLCLK